MRSAALPSHELHEHSAIRLEHRRAELSAHLVDDVIPRVPVRQWVLSLPVPLRYVLACPPGPDAPTSSDPDESVSPPGEPSTGASCEGFSLGDACVDETNFAQCQEMAAQCPGEVQVMESCPLQFACPE